MAKNATITIYQRKLDPDLKKMIKNLRLHDLESNRFYKRSESDIAKMILKDGLEKEQAKLIAKKL